MKTSLSIIGALALAFAVNGQSTVVNGTDQNVVIPPGAKIIQVPGGYEVVTNSDAVAAPAEWYTGATNIYWQLADAVTSSNLVYAGFMGCMTSGPKQGKPFGGALAIYNWSQNLGTGLGLYGSGGGWSMINANVQLMLPIQISPAFMLQMFSLAGLGTPMGGAGQSNGGATVVTEFGMDGQVAKIKSWDLGLGGWWGTMTGAGPYTGNNAGGTFTFSRGLTGSGFLGLFGRNTYGESEDAAWKADDLDL